MRRISGFTSVAAVAAVLVLASCYNVASNGNDEDGDSSDGPNSGNGTPSGNGSTGSNPSGNGGSGGSSSSADGGGGSASTASAAGGNGSGGSSSSGDGGSSGTGNSSSTSTSTGTSSGSSSTGSSGSGGSPPTGQHFLTYRFDMPENGLVPDMLTIYDIAMDGGGDPYPRPTPFNGTDYGMTYAWGVAVDAINDLDCYVENDDFVECQVTRPAYAFVEVNVHVQHNDAGDPPSRWSCEDPSIGLFQLWIDGVQTGFAYEPWPEAPTGPACRYYFILPN
jgi:hypothetical protein